MSVSFNGYDEGIVTFEAASGVAAGNPVAVSANGKVTAVTSNAFCGICKSVRNGYAAVQLKGYVQMPSTGSISLGYSKLAAAAGGKIKADSTNGREYLVVDFDSTANVVGFIL